MRCFAILLAFLVLAADSRGGVPFTRNQADRVTATVGRLLEQAHYRQAPLDEAIGQMFLKNYLDALDYNHLVFLQPDVDGFTKRYGKTIHELVRAGNSAPAFDIFSVYLVRLKERNELVQKILIEEMDFSVDEKFLPLRNKLPWPKDQSEAERLWRARMKFELLADRLSKDKAVADQPKVAEERLKIISKRYARLLKTMKEYDTTEILEAYLTALAHCYDPHSDYMSPIEATNFDINNVKLSLSGIGAVLQFEDGYTRIRSVVPGGPADMSKQIKPNDRIIAVAQGPAEPVDTVDMKLNKVVEMIRGPRNTEVRLTVIPATSVDGSERRIVKIIRDEIKLTEQKAKAVLTERTDAAGVAERWGVVTLPQFYEHCAADVSVLLQRMKKEGVKGIILDLRRNGGGMLTEAVDLAGLFYKKGPVVQVKDQRGRTQVLADTDPKVIYDGPLVVAVSHLSASASEIVAAALQDYGRAVIVGDKTTHGKGTVQTLMPLSQFINASMIPDPGKLKFTISKFYRVEGGTTQKEGVVPDVLLPSIYDFMEMGEASLPNCLSADRIDPVAHERMNLVQPHLAELRKRSAERLRGSVDFSYILQDIETVKKQREEKSVSLNETIRRAEKDEQKARGEVRKKERAQRPPPDYKLFEVTLETAEKNKPLPPALAKKAKEIKDVEVIGAVPNPDAEDPATAESEPTMDPYLEETLKILADHVRFLAGIKNLQVGTDKRGPEAR